MSDARRRFSSPLPARSGAPCPSVAGVGGGVGTSTVAAAIRGADLGLFTGQALDVLVCRGTAESVARAARAAHLVIDRGRRPMLVVTAMDPAKPNRALRARLSLLEPHAAGVVLLPYVPQWRDLTAPLETVRAMFARSTDEVPRPLRSYARAIGQLEIALGSDLRQPPVSRSPLTALSPARKERLR